MWKDSIKELLKEEAENGHRFRSSKHAACIVHRGSVLCIGHNKLKTHPMMQQFTDNPKKVYLHAEIDAIVKFVRSYGTELLSKCELYVLRLNKRGEIASSRPCPVCAKAIEAFGLTAHWTENENAK